jgi:hypothetical protein
MHQINSTIKSTNTNLEEKQKIFIFYNNELFSGMAPKNVFSLEDCSGVLSIFYTFQLL